MRKYLTALVAGLGLLLGSALAAQAEEIDPDCTLTLSGSVPSDPLGSARLIVDDGTTVHVATIGEDVEVGPFETDTTVHYRVFGGGERDNDDPLWTGTEGGVPSQEVLDYIDEHGASFVHGGVASVPGFVNWDSVVVTGCPADNGDNGNGSGNGEDNGENGENGSEDNGSEDNGAAGNGDKPNGSVPVPTTVPAGVGTLPETGPGGTALALLGLLGAVLVAGGGLLAWQQQRTRPGRYRA